MEDIQRAIELDPQNLKYRETLCLLHRVSATFLRAHVFEASKYVCVPQEMGQYAHAAEQLLAAHEAFMSAEARSAGRRAKATAQGSSGIGSIDWKQLSGSRQENFIRSSLLWHSKQPSLSTAKTWTAN
jgi:hypothetical protein